MLYIILLQCLILFCFTEHFTGGGFGWDRLTVDHGGPLHGRGIYYAVPLTALILGVQNWKLAVLTLGYALYRSPGWKIGDKGGMTPQTVEDTFYWFLRHLFALPLIAFAYWMGMNWKIGLITVPAFALVATVLGVWFGHEKATGKDVCPQTEIIRGLAFGAMIWSFTLPHFTLGSVAF